MKFRRFKQTTGVLLLSGLFTVSLLPQSASIDRVPKGESIQDARRAFQSFNPALANEILSKIWANPNATTENKIRAGKYLAKLNAKVFANPDKAKSLISKTIQLDPNDYEAYLILSQVDQKYETALQNARFATKYAKNKRQKIISYGSLGKVVLNAAIDKILTGSNVSNFSDYKLNKSNLINAAKQLERVMKEDPKRLELLKTKFALEVLAGRGTEALSTWRRYFNYSKNSNPLIRSTYAELEASLESWTGEKLSVDKKRSFAKALAAARYFDLSLAIIKTIPRSETETDNRLQEIVNYHRFLETVKSDTAEFYRKSALKQSDSNLYRNKLIANVKKLWSTFTWNGEPKKFSLDNVEIEIDKRFGAAIRIGNPNGFFSITWGHKVIEYKKDVEQYGRTGSIVFRSLDYLISNGFVGWYFDTNGTIGGWQSDNLTYQVRPRFLSEPFEAWTSVSNPQKIKEQKETIKRETERDINIAKKGDTVIYPGMLARITFTSRQELLDDLRQQGVSLNQLQNRFMSEFERLTFDNVILAHEGRHMIDSDLAKETNVKLPQEELEFRAKLSEIAFAKYPFMSLASILKWGTDGSAHGKANKRLVKGLYDWMEKNWKQVNGIDASLPKAPQLYKLTNNQLVAIVKSFDPLVSK